MSKDKKSDLAMLWDAMAPEKKKWMGKTPELCQLCDEVIKGKFADFRVPGASWAIACPTCHASYGGGVGTGIGQVYEENEHGVFIKVLQ